MKIENHHIFICGEGDSKLQIYFTLDLIPISVIFKYNVEVSESYSICPLTNNKYRIAVQKNPQYIDNIFTLEVYQQVVDLACKELSLEERIVYCSNIKPDKFVFSKDEYFAEFQFYGNFGRTYFVDTKLRHALKYNEQLENTLTWDIEHVRKGDDLEYEFYKQFKRIKRFLDIQAVFSRRDYHYISEKTMDNFIKNLGKKS